MNKEYKTPCYIFSEEDFCKRAERVKDKLKDYAQICFSIKANPFLLNVLPAAFSRVEVCSPGELKICQELKISPEKIIFSGVNKSYEDVSKAVDYKCYVLTAESLNHLEYINKKGLEDNKKIDVYLRLSSGNQFGMDEETISFILKNKDKYQGINIKGLHFFSGTQKNKIDVIKKELLKIKELAVDFEEIEYGPGLNVSYFSDDNKEEEMLEELVNCLREVNINKHLTLEMGRYFAADCGTYLTKVADIKTNDGINYAILDGGKHQINYDGQFLGMQTPLIEKYYGNNSEIKKWTLCGSLCTGNDILAKNVELDLNVGDVLAFKKAGAYSVMEGMSLFLSRDLPSVYLVRKDKSCELLRDRIDTYTFNMGGK